MNTLSTTVRADASDLGAFRHRFRAWLATSELPPELQDDTILAVHEAVAAAIEHGHPQDTITIRASIDEDAIAIEIIDGDWPSEDVDEALRLSLIQRCVEEIEIQPDHAGAIMRLRQPLNS